MLLLLLLQVAGAALYVLTRSAKFSLFKPAEEMVYLSLDARARLNGKAAVDVLGAQFGKSSGSMLQQALLVLTAGSAMASLPVMFVVFLVVAGQWGTSVDTLSRLVPPHTSMQSLDLDDDGSDAYEIEGVAPEELSAALGLSGGGDDGGEGVPGAQGPLVRANARWSGPQRCGPPRALRDGV